MTPSKPIRSTVELGLELRRQRKRLGLSQTELAARMNTRQATLSTLENGGADVRLSTLLDVLGALKLQMTFTPREGGEVSIEDLI